MAVPGPAEGTLERAGELHGEGPRWPHLQRWQDRGALALGPAALLPGQWLLRHSAPLGTAVMVPVLPGVPWEQPVPRAAGGSMGSVPTPAGAKCEGGCHRHVRRRERPDGAGMAGRRGGIAAGRHRGAAAAGHCGAVSSVAALTTLLFPSPGRRAGCASTSCRMSRLPSTT